VSEARENRHTQAAPTPARYSLPMLSEVMVGAPRSSKPDFPDSPQNKLLDNSFLLDNLELDGSTGPMFAWVDVKKATGETVLPIAVHFPDLLFALHVLIFRRNGTPPPHPDL
jgi:hypothetical protein